MSLSSYCGLNLPFSSLTEVHFLRITPQTLPESVRISFNPHPLFIVMPSSSVSNTSSSEAGISSLLSRQYIPKISAPQRFDERATSTATLPPPITTVFLPERSSLWFSAILCRISTALITPSASSPATPALRLPWQPIAM